jgi:hypothetical protein
VTPAGGGGGWSAAELDGDEGASDDGASDEGTNETETSVDADDPDTESPSVMGVAWAAVAGGGSAGAGGASAVHRHAGTPVGGATDAAGVSKMPRLNGNNNSSK